MLNLNECTKSKPKPTLIFKNSSYVCVCIIVHNNTAQHRTVLTIFRLTLQTITVAHMMSLMEGSGRWRRVSGLTTMMAYDTI